MSALRAGSPAGDLAAVGSELRRLNAESLEASVREAWDAVAELDRRRCSLLAGLTGESLARDPVLARALLLETLEATRMLEQRATAARDRVGEAMRALVKGRRATELYSTNAPPDR